jgi:hypothetical protein
MDTPKTAHEYEDDNTFKSAFFFAKLFNCGSFTITNINPNLDNEQIKQININYNQIYINFTNYILYCYGSKCIEPEWLKNLTQDKEPYCISKNLNGNPSQITRLKKLNDYKLIHFR